MAVKSNLSLNDFDVTNQEVRDAFVEITKIIFYITIFKLFLK